MGGSTVVQNLANLAGIDKINKLYARKYFVLHKNSAELRLQ